MSNPPEDPKLYPGVPFSWFIVSAFLALIGAAAFLIGASGAKAIRAWQVYVVNYVYWTGLAFGAVLFSAVLNLSKAVWGRPIKRLAEAFAGFLPVSYALFWVLWPGKTHIFSWIHDPIPEKQAFLNIPSLFLREGAGLLVLTVLSLTLVYFSVAADIRWLKDGRPAVRTTYPWTGFFRAQWLFSPALPAAYAFILSLFAVDILMSLQPEWYSTLFPGYYFIAAFYSAIVALYLFVLLFSKRLGISGYVYPRQLHDLGKLTFGFCIFTGYLFYAQFLVIWYGNLPEETRYVILRTRLLPWAPLAWAVLLMVFVLPFLALLSRSIKVRRGPMVLITGMVLVGLWMERFLLVVPSLWKETTIPIGVMEILISLGFLGLVSLSVAIFLSRIPILPVSDPLFHRFLSEGEGTLKP
jgi:hypothetical protein